MTKMHGLENAGPENAFWSRIFRSRIFSRPLVHRGDSISNATQSDDMDLSKCTETAMGWVHTRVCIDLGRVGLGRVFHLLISSIGFGWICRKYRVYKQTK